MAPTTTVTATTTTKPLIPWKVRFAMSLISTIASATRRHNDTVNRRLLNFIDRKVPPNPNTVDGVSSSDIVVDSKRELWFRLFIPSAVSAAPAAVTASLPVIVYFHGGGFAFMSPSSIPYDAVCRLFCRSFRAIVVSVNYRLTPEHRFPTQYDDGLEILKFLDQNGSVLGEFADVTKCFLAGDSAGGNLAHHVSVRASLEGLRVLKVIGLVSIQPFFGGEDRMESEIRFERVPVVSINQTDWYWKMFLPDGLDRDHGAVNVTGPNAEDISNVDYPNTLVFVGGFDPLADRGRKYYEWLRKSGKEVELIEYPNTIHAFYYFPDLAETCQLISQVKDFMAKQMSGFNMN